ncbi:hypothetical protein MTR_1g048600 [Medicago truncatula]|uniref:Transmembrane protein n=1 Tax=Medicago truncatula TaxID=3880 RepID=A0A072VT78_MEDTR|nr:hypothetical protein MTR_1g048600 [Medicago truncatula]
MDLNDFGEQVRNIWFYLFTVRIVETRSEMRESCLALKQYFWILASLLHATNSNMYVLRAQSSLSV